MEIWNNIKRLYSNSWIGNQKMGNRFLCFIRKYYEARPECGRR